MAAAAEGEGEARGRVAEGGLTSEEGRLAVEVGEVAEGQNWHFYFSVGMECEQGEWMERWWLSSWEWQSEEVAEVRPFVDVAEEVGAGAEVAEGEDGERKRDVGKAVGGAERNESGDQGEEAAAVAEARLQVQHQDGARLAAPPRLVRPCGVPYPCLRLHRHHRCLYLRQRHR